MLINYNFDAVSRFLLIKKNENFEINNFSLNNRGFEHEAKLEENEFFTVNFLQAVFVYNHSFIQDKYLGVLNWR